jgi:hypothetical protein
MHRALAAWLTARLWHAAFASALAGALATLFPLPFGVAAGAVAVLALLRFGSPVGIGIALTGAAAATLVLLGETRPTIWLFVAVALVFFGPVALANLLKRTGSMSLCVQVAVLVAAAAVVSIHVALDDPGAFWLPLVQQVIDSALDTSLYADNERAHVVQVWAQTMWGALAAVSLALVMGALFLGCWWHSLLSAPGAFGTEYRRLRLGVVLGTALTVLFALLVWNGSALLASLAWVGLPALVFQGLAAAHRSKARGSINRGGLAAIYVLLVVPISNWLTICALAIWGFIDNWRRPKTQGV